MHGALFSSSELRRQGDIQEVVVISLYGLRNPMLCQSLLLDRAERYQDIAFLFNRYFKMDRSAGVCWCPDCGQSPRRSFSQILAARASQLVEVELQGGN